MRFCDDAVSYCSLHSDVNVIPVRSNHSWGYWEGFWRPFIEWSTKTNESIAADLRPWNVVNSHPFYNVNLVTANKSIADSGPSYREKWWQDNDWTSTIINTSECSSTVPQINEWNDRYTWCLWNNTLVIVILPSVQLRYLDSPVQFITSDSGPDPSRGHPNP